MGRSPAPLALTLIACTPAAETAGEPPSANTPAATPATTPVEREPTPPEQVEGNEWFFAVVNQSGRRRCSEGRESEWLDVRPLLGFITVSGIELDGLTKLLEQPVLVRGNAGARPPDIAGLSRDIDPSCPIMQMRSDWIEAPKGILLDRGNHPDIEHFHATSARRLDELQARREGDEVIVEFTNPLPVALTEFQFVMHYEGCYGKPGSTAISRGPSRIEPGATLTERFPVIAEQDHGPQERKGGRPAREHVATTLELLGATEADAPPVYFDLDVRLAKLGLSVECP